VLAQASRNAGAGHSGPLITSCRVVMNSRDLRQNGGPIENCDRIASRLHQAVVKVAGPSCVRLEMLWAGCSRDCFAQNDAPHGPLATEAHVERLHPLDRIAGGKSLAADPVKPEVVE
jgi:hypothetical protein